MLDNKHHDDELWKKFELAQREQFKVLNELYHGLSNRTEMARMQLKNNPKNRSVWAFLAGLAPEELIPLFDMLMELATDMNYTCDLASNQILRIWRDWLIEHIENYAQPMLEKYKYEAYYTYMYLCSDPKKLGTKTA